MKRRKQATITFLIVFTFAGVIGGLAVIYPPADNPCPDGYLLVEVDLDGFDKVCAESAQAKRFPWGVLP